MKKDPLVLEEPFEVELSLQSWLNQLPHPLPLMKKDVLVLEVPFLAELSELTLFLMIQGELSKLEYYEADRKSSS